MNQLIKFVIVGSLAAFVHLGILRVAVNILSIAPFIANTIAFSIAFVVSYTGQSLWTFNHKPHDLQGTVFRFLATQLFCSFALNQGLYMLILTFTDINYLLASFIVLLVVPLATYSLSKYWAFK